MIKFSRIDEISFGATTLFSNDGDKLKLAIVPLDENKSKFGTKEFTKELTIKNSEVEYSFTIDFLADNLKIDIDNIKYVSAWIDTNGNESFEKGIDQYEVFEVNDDYIIEAKWLDKNKNPIKSHKLKDSKEVYYYIKTQNIKDETFAKFTLYDKDLLFFDDRITNLEFIINNNEAYIHIDFETIKFNLLKAYKDEDFVRGQIDEIVGETTRVIELIAQIDIDEYKVRKKLDSEKLKLLPEYIKVGTRSLSNTPSPDSVATEAPALVLKKLMYLLKAGEFVLDKLNVEFIHEHISFLDNTNIGFTEAYSNQEALNFKRDTYGQVKTDEQMSGLNTKEALDEYHWLYYFCDEDTMKEACYQAINENEYSSSSTIHQMNNGDIRRKEIEREESKTTTLPAFTRINSLSPKEGRRYNLLLDNCQSFIERVLEKYEALEKEGMKNEKLGQYNKQEGKGIAPIGSSISFGGF